MEYRHQKDFPNGLKSALLPREQFMPLPKYEDEAAWLRIPAQTRQFAIKEAEAILARPVPQTTASIYMTYYRTGIRNYEAAYVDPIRKALFWLTAAECVERKGRFMDALIDHIWAVCENTSWCLPPHNWQGLEGGWHNDGVRPLPDIQDPQLDIYACTFGEYLALVLHIMRSKLDEVTFLISERIEYELTKRIIEPFCNRRDAWWVTDSTHNWHMWITANSMMVTLLAETNPGKRAKAMELGMRYTEDFYRKYLTDGSTNEGPRYWGHAAGAMYYALKTIKVASNGVIDHFDEPAVRNIGSYIYRIHINSNEFYNYSYSPRVVDDLQGYEVYDFGKEICDEAMMHFGSYLYHLEKHPMLMSTHMYLMFLEFLYSDMLESVAPKAPYLGYYYSTKQQLMIAREMPNGDKGLFLGAKGFNGHFDSHRDGGSFILYNNCKPVYVEIGPPHYTKEVIDRRYRHYHITCIPQSHNSISVNGFGQVGGVLEGSMREEKLHRSDIDQISTQSTSSDDGNVASLTVQMGHMFDAESGVKTCARTFTLDRQAGTVTVHQKVECDRESDICLHFITAEKPVVEDGIHVGGTKLAYDTALFSVDTEEISTGNDWVLEQGWGKCLYRTTLTAHAKTLDAAVTITKE